MKKEWRDIISSYVGVDYILINSKLLSAQNRPRLYWTNICKLNEPKDKGVVLKDILLPYDKELSEHQGILVDHLMTMN